MGSLFGSFLAVRRGSDRYSAIGEDGISFKTEEADLPNDNLEVASMIQRYRVRLCPQDKMGAMGDY